MTEHEEFLALSAKVSERAATDEERARWRELRKKLVAAPRAPEGKKSRAHPRAAKKLRVHFAPLSELPLSFSDEVGGGGLRVRSPRHLAPGTEMVLRLDLSEPMCVRGRVIWSRREGGHFLVGIEWIGLSREERDRVEALALAPWEKT